MKIGRGESHGLAELLAGGFAVAGLQQSVGEVLADIGAAGRQGRGLPEERDGVVVVVGAQ
jgi:hypothetical protein